MFRHAAGQATSQAIAFVTGLVVVQSLGKTDYAFYSLAIAVIAASTVLADSGMGAATMQSASAASGDPTASQGVVRVALRYKGRLTAIFASLGTIWLIALLVGNGANLGTALLLASISISTMLPVASTTVYQIIHRVHLDFRLLRNLNLGVAIVRLGLISILAAVGALTAATVLVVGALCATVTLATLKLRARPLLDRESRSAPALPFRRTVSHVLPSVAAMILTEQAIFAILTLKSDPTVIAEMAALSRFAVFFAVLNSVVTDIASPLLARTPTVRRAVFQRYVTVCGIYILGVAALAISVHLTGPFLLTLLGPDYQGLELPLLVFALGFGLGNLAQVVATLNHARGATTWTWIYLPLSGIWLSVAILGIDVTSIQGASLLFLSQTLPALLTQALVAARYLSGLPKNSNGAD